MEVSISKNGKTLCRAWWQKSPSSVFASLKNLVWSWAKRFWLFLNVEWVQKQVVDWRTRNCWAWRQTYANNFETGEILRTRWLISLIWLTYKYSVIPAGKKESFRSRQAQKSLSKIIVTLMDNLKSIWPPKREMLISLELWQTWSTFRRGFDYGEIEEAVFRLLRQRPITGNDNMAAKVGNAYVYRSKYDR